MAKETVTIKLTRIEKEFKELKTLVKTSTCPFHEANTTRLTKNEDFQLNTTKTMEQIRLDLQKFSKTAEVLTEKLDENIKFTTAHSKQLDELSAKIERLENIEYKNSDGVPTKQKLSDIIQDIKNRESATYMINKYGTLATKLKSILWILGIVAVILYLAFSSYNQKIDKSEQKALYNSQMEINKAVVKLIEKNSLNSDTRNK